MHFYSVPDPAPEAWTTEEVQAAIDRLLRGRPTRLRKAQIARLILRRELVAPYVPARRGA